jgi:serine/threonine kinase 32
LIYLSVGSNPEDHLPPSHSRQPSQPSSMSGSPPLPADKSFTRSNPADPVGPIGENFPSEGQPSVTPSSHVECASRPRASPPLPSSSASFSRPLPPGPMNTLHQRGTTRKVSKGGGFQMVLEEAGTWSELADQTATLPTEACEGLTAKSKSSNTGMLAFLTRKKGRDRSPRPSERGVLGKEGSRHIIS